MKDLWAQIEPFLAQAERPARYINHEFGCVYKPEAEFRFCMVYPDTYELGQANQALRILVNAVNKVEGMAAERAFLPAPPMCDIMRSKEIPLFSIESCAPLSEFNVVGITLPHELAATNVLETLDLAGITLHSNERREEEPFVIAGGPCACNPEPYAPFFDFFSIGEGEEALPEILELIRKLREEGIAREAILLEVAKIPGFYVPSLYQMYEEKQAQHEKTWVKPLADLVPARIEKRIFEGFAASSGWEPCVVPFTEVVHDRLNVEILRGCARGCRFCQAGMMYRPVRERTDDNIVSSVVCGLAQTGYDEVSLTSLSSTDHSQISDILTRLNRSCEDKGVRISVPSQRLDAFGVDMAQLVAGQKKGGLTFAPEAGTQRLRDVINKNVTEEDFFAALEAGFKAGWRRCKLYFMIGLPTETDDDIKGIARLAQQAYDLAKSLVSVNQRGSIRMSISCALFVPKAQTPFQWDGQISPEEALRRINLLRASIKYRAIEVNWHDPSTSFVEAVMSRAGRDAAMWVEEAWKRGARFDAWTEYFNKQAWRDAADEIGLDPEQIAQASYTTDWVLPWSHISYGLSQEYLAQERLFAEKGETTPDCTFGCCTNCGVCSTYGVKNAIVASRSSYLKLKEESND